MTALARERGVFLVRKRHAQFTRIYPAWPGNGEFIRPVGQMHGHGGCGREDREQQKHQHRKKPPHQSLPPRSYLSA